MKQILSAAALAAAFAISVSAQATTPSQSQPQTPSSSPGAHTPHKSSSAQKKSTKKGVSNITLTGCLRQGDNPNTFTLDNVQMSQPDTSAMHQGTAGQTSTSEPTATSPSSSSSTSASSSTGSGTSTGMAAGMDMSNMGSVTLLANADIDLKDHVGHRVEVRGNLVGNDQTRSMTKDKGSSTSSSDTMGSGSSASSSSATGTSNPAATGTSGASDSNAHTLRVRGFRHISDTCSQQ